VTGGGVTGGGSTGGGCTGGGDVQVDQERQHRVVVPGRDAVARQVDRVRAVLLADQLREVTVWILRERQDPGLRLVAGHAALRDETDHAVGREALADRLAPHPVVEVEAVARLPRSGGDAERRVGVEGRGDALVRRVGEVDRAPVAERRERVAEGRVRHQESLLPAAPSSCTATPDIRRRARLGEISTSSFAPRLVVTIGLQAVVVARGDERLHALANVRGGAAAGEEVVEHDQVGERGTESSSSAARSESRCRLRVTHRAGRRSPCRARP
jgi:hypothetical protein